MINWNVADRRRITTLRTDEKFADTADFSDDGRLLATGGINGNAILCDTDTCQRGVRVLSGRAGFVITLDFDSRGATLATSSTDGNVRFLGMSPPKVDRVGPSGPRRAACSVAGTNLTRGEWSQFLPGCDDRAVCP